MSSYLCSRLRNTVISFVACISPFSLGGADAVFVGFYGFIRAASFSKCLAEQFPCSGILRVQHHRLAQVIDGLVVLFEIEIFAAEP